MSNPFDQFDSVSPLVGMPANGTQYSPAQMAQLNAARDALRAAENRGESYTYNAKPQGNPFDQFDGASNTAAANPDAALGGTLQFGVPFTSARFDTGIPLPADLEAALVAAGKKTSDIVRGLEQPFASSNPSNLSDLVTGQTPASRLRAQVADDNTAYAPLAQAHPKSTFAGESLPYFAAGSSIPAMMAIAGAEYGTPGQRALRAGAAGLGGLAGKGIARIVGGPQSMAGVPNTAADFADYAASAGNKFGIPTTVGMNGSPTAKLAESVIANMPFVNGPVNSARQAAFEGFNSALSKTFGEDSTKITPELLGDAMDRSGQQIGNIMSRASIQLSPNQASQIAQLSSDVADLGADGGVVANKIQQLIDRTTNGNSLSGQALRKFDTSIGRVIGTSQSGDVRYAAGALQNIVRDATSDSLSSADNAALTLARQQNFNVRQVADATKATPGSVSPSQLLTAVNKAQRASRYGGGNDLAELARFAKPTLTDQIPNSGTPQRLLMQKFLTNPVTGAAEVAGLAYAADKTDNPYLYGSLGLLGPLLVGRALAGRPTSALARNLLTRAGGTGGLLGYDALATP